MVILLVGFTNSWTSCHWPKSFSFNAFFLSVLFHMNAHFFVCIDIGIAAQHTKIYTCTYQHDFLSLCFCTWQNAIEIICNCLLFFSIDYDMHTHIWTLCSTSTTNIDHFFFAVDGGVCVCEFSICFIVTVVPVIFQFSNFHFVICQKGSLWPYFFHWTKSHKYAWREREREWVNANSFIFHCLYLHISTETLHTLFEINKYFAIHFKHSYVYSYIPKLCLMCDILVYLLTHFPQQKMWKAWYCFHSQCIIQKWSHFSCFPTGVWI